MDTEIRSKPWSRHLLRWIGAVGSVLAMALLAAPASAIIEADGFVALVPSSVFKFVVELPDDGTDSGGGWQVAKAVVPIHDSRKMNPMGMWSCNVKVGMPLRTTKDGQISAKKAAQISADVAEIAWANVLPRRPPGEWTSGTFCNCYWQEMQRIFKKEKYTTVGATVSQWK
jgi:hypothetical protein